jgi:hypothetical protein
MATKKLIPGVAERTVLTYVKLDFRGEWEYFISNYGFRPAKEKAELLVVSEAPTGNLVTHYFIVRRRPDPPPPNGIIPTDGVLVPEQENIVYIPETCIRVEKGDRTKCTGLTK